MIRFEHVTITYPDDPTPTLLDVDLVIEEGELALVVGRTGVGKSTLLGAVNGLVPHFTGGTLAGRVTVNGLSTDQHPPRELAGLVGVVGQDPLAGFVTDTVEEELAYSMEQLGISPQTMRKRVEETLDLLGIAALRGRTLRTLSGGQQQRVAIGSVLAAGSRVLVLDEPTSALDPTSAEEVLATVLRLVHDLGVTAVIAEHRMERVVEYADRVVLLTGDGRVEIGEPAAMMSRTVVAPPVVGLAKLLDWQPLPLSVRSARRLAGPLRQRLAGIEAGTVPRRVSGRAGPQSPSSGSPSAGSTGAGSPSAGSSSAISPRTGSFLPHPPKPGTPGSGLVATGIVVSYGRTIAVAGVSLTVARGEVVALMGRNGSGKSSLLWALTGVGPRKAGRAEIDGIDTGGLTAATARTMVGLVPQTPGDLLYLDTVAAECAAADQESDQPAGSCAALLTRLVPGIDARSHPRDLSEGQRLSLVLAVQLTARPPVLLLDEPTRGLDYGAKHNLAEILTELAVSGRAVLVSTHDVEFVAEVAGRVVVMAEGEIVADGPAEDVIGSSPMFASQVAKVLSPEPWLTVGQVRNALMLVDRTGAATDESNKRPQRAGEHPEVPARSDP